MAFEIPIFPLNVVLFPDMPLPLHIFEPRYRLMMSRVLEADDVFGVALLNDDDETPAIVGCTAKIIEDTPLPDGRMNLQCEGRRRFRILSLREEDSYLIGNVEWLDDAPHEIQAETQTCADEVRRALRRYLVLIAPESQSAVNELEMPEDAEGLSFWVGMLLASPNAQKQQLLETLSTLARLQAELQLLQRAQIVQQAFLQRARFTRAEQSDESSHSDSSFAWLN